MSILLSSNSTHLTQELLFVVQEVKRSQQQGNSMTPVTEHDGKQEGERHYGENSRIGLLIACHPAIFSNAGSVKQQIRALMMKTVRLHGSKTAQIWIFHCKVAQEHHHPCK